MQLTVVAEDVSQLMQSHQELGVVRVLYQS